MLPRVARMKLTRKICSECEILQAQLDAATDSIVDIVNKAFTDTQEKSQQLDNALETRDNVLRNYLQHLEDHGYLTAA